VGAAADLVIDNLSVEYRTRGDVVRPFERFDLRATDGELVALRGPSGCGKTTVLSVLAGQLAPTTGTVTYRGRPVAGHRTVGVVFQAFNLIPSLTAAENVMAPLVLTGTPRRRARSTADALLDAFGLSDRADHRPGTLSGGEKQRVAFARALVHDPPLLLADEPTAHLDSDHVGVVLDVLRRLAADGRLVVVATHDDRVSALADTVTHLAPSLELA
jgi:putative ABC transport system ATP-binding protein